jgi:four helix bundle protein
MSRDHRKLAVFALADQLVTEVYKVSGGFPPSERFGLQMQLRKAAVSVASNIVEGSARRTTREYLNFLNIATGSAAEAKYLTEVSRRLGFLTSIDGERVGTSYSGLVAKLKALVNSLSNEEECKDPRPKAQSRKPKADHPQSL